MKKSNLNKVKNPPERQKFTHMPKNSSEVFKFYLTTLIAGFLLSLLSHSIVSTLPVTTKEVWQYLPFLCVIFTTYIVFFECANICIPAGDARWQMLANIMGKGISVCKVICLITLAGIIIHSACYFINFGLTETAIIWYILTLSLAWLITGIMIFYRSL